MIGRIRMNREIETNGRNIKEKNRQITIATRVTMMQKMMTGIVSARLTKSELMILEMMSSNGTTKTLRRMSLTFSHQLMEPLKIWEEPRALLRPLPVALLDQVETTK